MDIHFSLNNDYCSRYKDVKLYDKRVSKGSWRDMLVTQTPSAVIRVRLRLHKKIRDGYCFPPGSTMSDNFGWLARTYTETLGSQEWRKYAATDKELLRTLIEEGEHLHRLLSR